MADSSQWSQEELDAYAKRYAPAAPAAPAKPAGDPSAGAGSGVMFNNSAPATSIPDQAAAASTYSATPGAAPTPATANQGTQDVVRNSWLAKATQPTTVDPNDPNIKQQTDVYAAQQQRTQAEADAQAAERLSAQGLGNSGQMGQEQRYNAERAGQATGAFQANLVGQELQNKRSEIQDALNHLGDTISNDQKNQLTQQLADLDAAIKREGIQSTAQVGNREIDVKQALGNAANSNDLMKAMLQNQQYNDGQAFNWSNFDWETSPMNPKNQ